MKFKSIVLAAMAVVAAPAFASIASGKTEAGTTAAYSGNGELFLAVYDEVAQISYTKDLGMTLAQYSALSQPYLAQVAVDDANWTSFLAQADVNNLRWVVQGYDTNGTYRLFTTVKNGDEALLQTEEIGKFRNGMGQALNFFNSVNSTGTHAPASQYAINGTSVNAIGDSGKSYFGEAGGATSFLNGNFTTDMSNVVGASAHFALATNPSITALNPIDVTYFNSNWIFAADANGAYTLTSAVPEAGTLATMLAGLAVLGGLARRRLSA